MIYHVINGELSVGIVKITNLTTTSTLLIGDSKRVALSLTYETPPEELIVGVTVGQMPQCRRP